MGKKGKKEKLDRLSMWPLDPGDALGGFMEVDPDKVEDRERAEREDEDESEDEDSSK